MIVVFGFLSRTLFVVFLFQLAIILNASALTDDQVRAVVGLANTHQLKQNLMVHVHNAVIDHNGYETGHMPISPRTLVAPEGRSYFQHFDIRNIFDILDDALNQALQPQKPANITFSYRNTVPAWNGVVTIHCLFPNNIGSDTNGNPTRKLRIVIRDAMGHNPYFASAFPVS